MEPDLGIIVASLPILWPIALAAWSKLTGKSISRLDNSLQYRHTRTSLGVHEKSPLSIYIDKHDEQGHCHSQVAEEDQAKEVGQLEAHGTLQESPLQKAKSASVQELSGID